MKYSIYIVLILMFSVSFDAFADATEQGTVDNGDGTFTYTQKITGTSTPPHYSAPSGYGFDEYSWFNEDYGWQHNFADYNRQNMQIVSATLLIRGWDVDSEPFHGASGEYDGISVDGVDLDPGLLQGTNNNWSETSFDVPINSITDDGLMNVFLDIDMNHTSRRWATTLDYSLLTINYAVLSNDPPHQPQVSYSPPSAVTVGDDLVATVDGPTPPDPDGNNVTYRYRWFVDVGQGYFIDDNFAGKNDHTGNTVPASQTASGERWRCTVTPVDSNDIVGAATTITWSVVGDADNDGVLDEVDAYPLDSERAFINRTPATGYYTLAFEDLWPLQGDYDLNDLVLHYAYTLVTDSDNKVKQIDMQGEFVARGAARANGFAISFEGTESSNFESASMNLAGVTSSLTPEAGHSGELVMVLVDNVNQALPGSGEYSFYNTNTGDSRSSKTFTFSMNLNQSVSLSVLGSVPFNPFIFATFMRGIEVHLPNKPPTDLADANLFGTGDDASNANNGKYYRTSSNLPWALNITSQWKHPYEQVDVGLAYPLIRSWAQSSGNSNHGWYNAPSVNHCWSCK